ncbi:MAG: hypothetical protein AB8C46_01640 [Burkholderiaceae bacterium]
MREHLGQAPSIINMVARLAKGTGIDTRHYAHPHWLPEGKSPFDYPEAIEVSSEQDIFTPNGFVPPYHQRMAVFHTTAVRMAVKAAAKALQDWGGRPDEISHIFTTCTSGWSEPGIAVAVMQALDLPSDCQKAELNFNGCFCGATCLRLARDAIRAGDATGVLVVAVEVASTHYDLNATDTSSLVAHTLFADGAGSVVLAPEGRWKYTHAGMSLVPQSTHLLGLDPPLKPEHSAYRMTLDKKVGPSLRDYFMGVNGANLLAKIMQDEMQPQQTALAIHPGGPNILHHVGGVFFNRGWTESALDYSYETLRSVGNLGAAAMLFVLDRTLRGTEEDTLITMAFGPGVTVEWATLSRSI